MAFCTHCGAALSDGASFCSNCGAPVAGQSPAAAQSPVYTTYAPSAQYVSPYPTGGLMAWSIVTLLLCTIPGIVAIVKTASINKCTTLEQQERAIRSARTWCIVGTVLGILLIIGVSAGSF